MSEHRLGLIEVRDAFRGPIAPLRVTHSYRIQLIGVMLGLIALQALYLLLVLSVAYLTWISTVSILQTGLTLNLITIVFYVGPPVAGIIVTLFLLKPLIIRPPKAPLTMEIERGDQPILFEFVDRICRSLGSPRPKRVFIDLRVNASASLHGWRGFFFGRMDLTIGLPLTVDLSLPQFAGVLSHEFGHFAQHTGMRSYYLIQRIQNWFSRVVQQRDTMDTWLDRQREHNDWRVKIVATLAGMAVWLSRRYLTFLMRAAEWISAAFSRQMEFDADRHEVAIVGPDVFEATLDRISILNIGSILAWQDAAQDHQMSILPEDIPRLVGHRTGQITEESVASIVTGEREQTTSRLDTHPCTAERVARARSIGLTGIFHLDGPAAGLFLNLPQLCQQATLHHYRTVLKLANVDNGTIRLVSADEAITRAGDAANYAGAALELFGSNAEFCSRWFRVPCHEPTETSDSTNESMEALDLNPEAYDSALHTNLLHFAALTLVNGGVKVDRASFALQATDPAAIREQETVTTRNLDLALEHNRETARHLAKRIEAAIAHLVGQDSDLAPGTGGCGDTSDVRHVWHAYGILSHLQDTLMDIRRSFFALRIVRVNARHFPAAVCANLIADLEDGACEQIDRIVSRTAETPATIQLDPSRALTLGKQLEPTQHSKSERIGEFIRRFDTLASRTLGQLAVLTIAASRDADNQTARASGYN